MEVTLNLNDDGKGKFTVMDNNEQLGEMIVKVTNHDLTVYHTEVEPKAEGKGLAKKMLTEMVSYARRNSLKVIPVCEYVKAQFNRHPEEYADVVK